MSCRLLALAVLLSALAACGVTPVEQSGTLAELDTMEPDIEEVYLEDSLERAAESYRRYLAETQESELTPEAMRRLADLQLEREYGVIGAPAAKTAERQPAERQPAERQAADMQAPEAARRQAATTKSAAANPAAIESGESDTDFEARASERQALLTNDTDLAALPPGETATIPAGPLEAIETYQKILATYPNYEYIDQVYYQMTRAYEELGRTDEAVEVMNRLLAEHPGSKYVDEVYFRRGEYFFVRKRFLDAEESYAAITAMGPSSNYYELALYKLGWSLYKQELYEDALHQYLAMLDYRADTGFDFDSIDPDDEEHRVTDTFRVISLAFSNLGDANVVNEYFAEYGHRSYADKIYNNLGEFYFEKLRYEDAASVYKSFIALNPRHKASPYFSMRVIDIYSEAGFPQLVVEAKKEFAGTYAIDAAYWSAIDINESAEVVGFLKTNLEDLANHYHALYQEPALVEEQPGHFAEARRWYGQYIDSFPEDEDTPPINYQLADLLLENGEFNAAALEYERTAYDYAPHEQNAEAGYAAVYAHRQNLEATDEAAQLPVRQAMVASSLRFADTYPDHEQAAVVLGAAADELYGMQDFLPAIAAAEKLIARYPETDPELVRAAWTVVAHSSIDIEAYPRAEEAYINVLALTGEDDESRADIVDGLAASIYKQGEQALDAEDYRAAADNFLRIKDVAPGSAIRTAAEYDAAAALIRLEDWTQASGVLEAFRQEFPEHELNAEATKQLAFVYREDGQTERAASEYERISAEADDPELAREALLTAAELYDEVSSVGNAIRVYLEYVEAYPRPLDYVMESRTRLAAIFRETGDDDRYFAQLDAIVATDADAGADRTDRSRFLAAKAALVLAEQHFEHFAALELTLPFEESLADKQARMDAALNAFEALVDYEVADVTAAATYYIAETYFGFSVALLESERPDGLSASQNLDYDMALEEEAYPFEERGIEVHEANYELLTKSAVYNEWVQKSLDKLAVLIPSRYAKNEISSGFLGSIDVYAYRMPIAPEPVEPGTETEVTAQLSEGAK
ncbi:MAG: tetratricopeptide repeat protein [Woeseiaceae bacterium]|nr:tetratricopeptide repeat protein [Woeseiaceae bacterium]